MQIRNPAPILVSLFAALAVVYPVLSVGTADNNHPVPTKTLLGMPETPEREGAVQGFPTAKDIVARFLFSHTDAHGSLTGNVGSEAYEIEFLIATAPDPIVSRLPNFFDSFAESIGSAAEAAGYTLDRFALPWMESDKDQKASSLWKQTLGESAPGLILFRNPHGQKLLLVFLVGETPTTGIHKRAMFSALEQMAQFYPWDPRRAELPPQFPQVKRQSSSDIVRVMGPAFSGSAVSLRFVLDDWLKSRGNVPNLRFQIISGTATAIDASQLSRAGHDQATFQATVPPDDETLQDVACYIQRIGYPRVAILTEGNTVYGQSLAHDIAEHGKGAGRPPKPCEDTAGVPEILDLPFPLHISNLREASVQRATAQEQTGSGTANLKSSLPALVQENTTEPREVLPAFSDLTVQSAELTLSNLLSTIARERYSYVGIVATDLRDATFLAGEVRRHCPATVLFTLNSDLLYASRDVNSFTRGMLVITPYPLFNLEQLWTYPYRGGETRLQFSSQAAEGVYNATLALLHQEAKMVDYGRPLPGSAGASPSSVYKPSLWVTAIGNGETLPVSLLRWEDSKGYTYSPDPARGATDPQAEPARKPDVGRGIYSENAVVVVIILSLLTCLFSLLIVWQYRRPGKQRGADRISALVGDTASPAYWFEGRLFLFCCCSSLLTFYFLVAVDFCLPFIAGRELGSNVQTTLTPKVAICLEVVTILLLLLSALALVSALRALPADQKGFAPEVTLFALLGCALVFILSGLLVISWYKAVKQYPASGLFSFLRSFDLKGGLSPLLPLFCVAAAACLWALCSYRRLRLIDILRASGSAEKSNPCLSFMPQEGRSFNGVPELENNIKHNLESASVISPQGYAVALAVALAAGHYFFDTRLVRALEERPFYWIFEAAFFIVYWALLMEFMRLVLAWRSLHLLLRRLSWHPLHAAFKRYHQRFPTAAKMNLTHPPSSFTVLESSVEQARNVLRSARTLSQAANAEPGTRELCRQSIPEWEAELQAAEAQLYEALRLQLTDPSQVGGHSDLKSIPTKHAGRLKGDWRTSLASRSRVHLALFRLMQSLIGPLEQHWFSSQGEDSTATATTFYEQAEEFVVTRVVSFLTVVFPSLQNLGYFVLVGLLLMLLAVTSYPFQPRNEFLFFNWVVILFFIGTAFWIFVQMDRDTVLSLLNGTKPGQIHFSLELVLRTFLYIGAPLLALLGAQFPESWGKIISVFTASGGNP